MNDFVEYKSTKELAFNIARIAFDYNYPDRTPNQTLVVSKFTKLMGAQRFAAMLANGEATSPPLHPSKAEIDESKKSAYKGLWVGMRPSQASQWTPEAINKKRKEEAEDEPTKKPSKTGRHGPAAASKLPAAVRTHCKGSSIEDTKGGGRLEIKDKNALRVVAPIGKENANYYALINQNDGLCTGIHIDIEEVFFFPEYRGDDTSTSIHDRRATWGRIVREAIKEKSIEKVAFVKGYDKRRFNVTPTLSLATEVVSLAAAYELGGNKTILSQMLSILSDLDPDSKYEPPVTNRGLRDMLTRQDKMSLLDCEVVVNEIACLWPDLSPLEITAMEVSKISDALRDENVVLEFRLVRAFLVEACWRIRCAGPEITEFANSTRTHVLLQLGDVPPAVVSVGENAFAAFCTAEADKIHAIAELSRRQTKALKDSQGDHLIADDLPSIWTTFGESPDVDSAKLYAQHMHRFNVSAISKHRLEIEQYLDKHEEQLRSFASMLNSDKVEEEGGAAAV